MKVIYFLILCFTFANSEAQESIISMMAAINEQPRFNKGVKSVKETNYSIHEITEGGHKLDTIIVFDEKDYPLFYTGYNISLYGENNIETKHYDEKDELTITTDSDYDEEGRMISQKIVREGATAMFNTTKIMTYDDAGRLVSVNQGGAEALKITYRKGLIPESFSMDGGFMKVNAELEQVGDTLRYELKGDLGEFMEMLSAAEQEEAQKEFPKEQIDLILEGEKYHFFSSKQNMETGKMEINSEQITDKNLRILEQVQSDAYTDVHYVYTYNDQGQKLSRTDKKSDTTINWEYDDKGRSVKSYTDGEIVYSTYDDQDNPVLKLKSYILQADKISSATVLKYEYK